MAHRSVGHPVGLETILKVKCRRHLDGPHLRAMTSWVWAHTRHCYGLVPGWAAAGEGGGAVEVAPGKLTTGACCAAALAANGVACL